MTLSKRFTLLLFTLCLVFTLSCRDESSSHFGDKPQASKSIEHLMFERYTVRTFDSTKMVKEEDLEQILRAGILSPSQNFRYGWQVHVFGQSKRARHIMDQIWRKYAAYEGHCDKNGNPYIQYLSALKTAPVTILFMGKFKKMDFDDNNVLGTTDVERLTTRDAMISATAMMLQAEQLGYKTAFNGNLDLTDELRRLIYQDKFEENKDTFRIVQLGIGHPGPVYDLAEIDSMYAEGKGLIVNLECEDGARVAPRFTRVDVKDKHPVISFTKDIGNQKRKYRRDLILRY